MSYSKIGVKNGMGGSRCGKGRRDPTAILKTWGKKARRRADKRAARLES